MKDMTRPPGRRIGVPIPSGAETMREPHHRPESATMPPTLRSSAASQFPCDPTSRRIPDPLWPAIAAKAPPVILLDFDTTLVHFTTSRRPTRLAPHMRRVLKSLIRHRPEGLIISSERGLDEFRGLLRDIPAHLIGENGWELLRPEGDRRIHTIPASTAQALDRAWTVARACGWARHIRRRRTSMRLSIEGLPVEWHRSRIELWEQFLSPRFETGGLVMCPSATGPELRAIEHTTVTAMGEYVRRHGPVQAFVHVTVAPPAIERPALPVTVAHDVKTDQVRVVSLRLGAVRELPGLLREWNTRFGVGGLPELGIDTGVCE